MADPLGYNGQLFALPGGPLIAEPREQPIDGEKSQRPSQFGAESVAQPAVAVGLASDVCPHAIAYKIAAGLQKTPTHLVIGKEVLPGVQRAVR